MHRDNTDPKARPEKKTLCTLRKIPVVILHVKGCILFATQLTNWCGSSRKLVSNFPTCCSNETGKQRRTRVELTNKRIYSHLEMPKELKSHIQTLSNAVIFHFPRVRCTIKIIKFVLCLPQAVSQYQSISENHCMRVSSAWSHENHFPVTFCLF